MRYRYNQQKGAVLLLMLLVLIAGATWLLLDIFTSITSVGLSHKVKSNDALLKAKSALIGYAISYPEISAQVDAGPGHLPCPDTNNNGSANPPCNAAAAGGNPEVVSIGRIPWRILNSGNLTDSNGDTLWYAISSNYRNDVNKVQPMNSDVPGTLGVDAGNDIVAVIFSPGRALAAQNRPSNNPVDYLEDDNNDGDVNFVTTLTQIGGESDEDYQERLKTGFNDVVMVITRNELMAAVEKRVLAETRDILNTYFSNYGSYPWLSPFTDTDYNNTAGTREGRLPVQLDYEIGDEFNVEFSAMWFFSDAAIYNGNPGLFTDESIISASTTPINFTGVCRWVGEVYEIACRGNAIVGFFRNWSVDFGYAPVAEFSGNMLLTTPATSIDASGLRKQFVNITSNFPDYENAGEINISLTIFGQNISLAVDDDTTGQLVIIMDHKLSYEEFDVIDPGTGDTVSLTDMPEWYFKNEWYKYILISETQHVDPFGAVGDCDFNIPGDCLLVNGTGVASNANEGIQVALVSSGPQLAGQNRNNELLINYFENGNETSGDQTFQTLVFPNVAGMNDQVKTITNSEVPP